MEKRSPRDRTSLHWSSRQREKASVACLFILTVSLATSLLGAYDVRNAWAADVGNTTWNFDNNVGYVLRLSDSNYISFRSYVSQTSTTSLSRAFIGYRSSASNGVNYPKTRSWDGSSWGSQTQLSTAGSPVRWVRAASSPLLSRFYERIIVTLSDDGYLDAYVWSGSSWSTTNNIGSVGTAASTYRAFDIAYETTSGRAILVYSVNSTDPTGDLAYRIWSGSSWSAVSYLDDTGHTSDVQYHWVELASDPASGSNEISLIALEGTTASGSVRAWIWSGSSWKNELGLVANTVKTRENIGVAYESQSGNAMFVWGDSSQQGYYSQRWLGSSWEGTTGLVLGLNANQPSWLTLKSDPASNAVMCLAIDSSSNLSTAVWDGIGWTAYSNQDSVFYESTRDADGDWEPIGSKYLMVYYNSGTQVKMMTWTPASGWSTASTVTVATSEYWIQLRRNQRQVTGDVRILGAMLNANNTIGGLKWNGTALTNLGDTLFATSTTVTTYECFDLRFQTLGDAIYSSEVQFAGSSNIQSWTQVVWTVQTRWTVGSVNVTLQLYDYNGGSYPSSGDGYIYYISNAVANTNENKTQTITSNPENFRDASGNWKVKIKGVKLSGSRLTMDSYVNWIEYKPTPAVAREVIPYNPSLYTLVGSTTLVSAGDTNWYNLRDRSSPLASTVTVSASIVKSWLSDRTQSDRYTTSPIPAGSTWVIFLSWQSKTSSAYNLPFTIYTSQGTTTQTQIVTGTINLPSGSGAGTITVTVNQASDITPSQTPYDIALRLSPSATNPSLVLKTGSGGSYLQYQLPPMSVTGRVISATNCSISCGSGNNITGSPPTINVDTEYWFSTTVFDPNGLTDVDNIVIYLYKTGVTKTTFDQQRAYGFRWVRNSWSGSGTIPCSDTNGCWHELTGANTWSTSLTYLITVDSTHSTTGAALTGTWTFAAKLSKLAQYTSTNMDWNYEVVMQNIALSSASRIGWLDVNLYVSIIVPTAISFGTISAGQNNASAPINPYVATYTGNAILLFQVWGAGPPTNEFGDSFPLSNVYVGQTANPANNDGIKLSTSPQNLYSNLPVALNQNQNMYWFITTPDPFPPGTYTFQYVINIDYQTWAT